MRKIRKASTKLWVINIVLLIISSSLGVVESGGNSEQDASEPLIVDNDTISGFPAGWSDDIQLSNISSNNNESYPNYKIGEPKIETHENYIHVIWEDNQIGDPGPIVTTNVTYCRSTDYGRSWEPSYYLTYLEDGHVFNAMYAQNPDLTVNGSNIHVVWWQQNDSFQALRYRKSIDNGETWGEILNIVDFHFSNPPRDADIVAWGNNLHVVWREGTGGKELWYSNSTDNGDSWSQPKQLVSEKCSSGKLAVNGSKVHLIFNQWYNGGSGNANEIFYMNSTDNGVTWSSWQLLTPADGRSHGGFDVALENENIYISYSDDRDEIPNPWGGFTSQIYYTNSSDGGITWAADQRLTYSANYSHNPYIDVENGTIQIVWINRTGDVEYAPEVYYMNSTDGGVTWTPNTRLTYFRLGNGPSDIKFDGDRIYVLFGGTWKEEYFIGEVYFKRYPDFPPDATSPWLEHTPLTAEEVGEDINISARVWDDQSGVVNVTIFYGGVGETGYSPIKMSFMWGNRWNGTWKGTIPAQSTTGMVYYYILANDSSGNNATSPVMGDYAIQITGPPSIEVTNPIGGEDWSGGSIHQIEFSASDTEDAPANLDIFLNYTSSAGNGVIAQIKGDVSPYDWTLPIIDATDIIVNATVIDSEGNKNYDDSLEFTIDSSPPEVISTNPVNNSTGISIFQPVIIQFNEPMNISSVIVNQTNGTDPSGWSWFWNEDKDTITGIHDAWLRGEIVEITVQAGYMDDSEPGNANNTAFVFSFTTETNPSPEIVHTNISGSIELGDEIRINATITDDGTVMNAVVWLWDVDDNWIESNMEKNGDDWEYIIPGQMKEGRVRYMINATDDLQQKNTTAVYEFYIEDTTPPEITHTHLESAVIGEPINITCQVTDSGGVNSSAIYFVYRYEGDSEFMVELMNPSFWFELPVHSVPATIEYYLQASDIYSNDASTQVYSLEIIDPSVPDTTPPEILLATPTGDSIPISTNISIVFSEAVNRTAVEGAISVSPTISGISYIWLNNQTLMIEISGNFSYNTTYSVTIDTGAKDLAGNTLANNYTWQFTTVEDLEIVQPPASNDWGWIIIIIILSAFIALLLFYQLRERKEKEPEE